MTRLHDLYLQQNQSPWLDNLRREWLRSGELAQWLDKGVRGITSNPTIFAKSMMETDDYNADLARLATEGKTIEEIYWELAVADVGDALDLLAPLYRDSDKEDGYVSIEVDPRLAHESAATLQAARNLVAQINRPNLYIKVPATIAGLDAIRTLTAESISVNVTLIFGLDRYSDVMEAYISGLEANPSDNLSTISSVASFFVSRLDVEIDKRLGALASDEALALQGQGALALSQVAYDLFQNTFSGSRWEALADRGARVQRPLWASTSTKNPEYPDTLYVDNLIGPQTVNTLPDATISAFLDHGSVSRTVDADLESSHATVEQLGVLGIDVNDVSEVLETEGVASFEASFDDVLASLKARAEQDR